MNADATQVRAAILDRWERSADGWLARNEAFQAAVEPVSRWLVAAVEPRPGEDLLDLAAGVGETGFRAAALLQPEGRLYCVDAAESMLAAARQRAEQLGLRGVEVLRGDLEAIPLASGAVDAVLCRWGYMFALDRAAALAETARVLRPGGRLALATWAAEQKNPWAGLLTRALMRQGLAPDRTPGAPGPFDLNSAASIERLLAAGEFGQVRIAEIGIRFRYPDLDDYWEASLALSRPFADIVEGLEAPTLGALRAEVDTAVAPFRAADGSLSIPGQALVASADLITELG